MDEQDIGGRSRKRLILVPIVAGVLALAIAICFGVSRRPADGESTAVARAETMLSETGHRPLAESVARAAARPGGPPG